MNPLRGKKTALFLSAASQIKYLLKRKSDPSIIGVKLGVRRRGCNGFSYVMDYARTINKMDEMVEEKGVRLLIDAKALMFVVGTEMDYVTSDIKSEFVFNNPNSKGECGCGESFNV